MEETKKDEYALTIEKRRGLKILDIKGFSALFLEKVRKILMVCQKKNALLRRIDQPGGNVADPHQVKALNRSGGQGIRFQ